MKKVGPFPHFIQVAPPGWWLHSPPAPDYLQNIQSGNRGLFRLPSLFTFGRSAQSEPDFQSNLRVLSPVDFAILAKSNLASMPSGKILLWQKWSAFLWLSSGFTQRIPFCEEVLQNPCALRVSECMPFCPFSNLVWGTPVPRWPRFLFPKKGRNTG